MAWALTPDGSSISFSAGKLQSVSTEQVMGSFLSFSRKASKGCSYCSFYRMQAPYPDKVLVLFELDPRCCGSAVTMGPASSVGVHGWSVPDSSIIS